MPNQNNFRSDVTTKTDANVTYLASRIVRIPEEVIFLEEVPASVGYDNEDNIEIHFYSVPSNVRILSTTTNLKNEILKSHIVSFEDGTYKNYIRIDFTKLFEKNSLLLIPGDYRMVLNFFSDEVGSYTNRKLSVTNISETRTEVELSFNDSIDEVSRAENEKLLYEFVEPSFTKPDAVGVAEKIFKSGVELNNPDEGTTSTTVIENIEVPAIINTSGNVPREQTFENTIARMERIGLRKIFEQQLNDFITTLFDPVREQLVVNGDERIQEPEFQSFIRQVVGDNITNLRQTVDARIKVQ